MIVAERRGGGLPWPTTRGGTCWRREGRSAPAPHLARFPSLPATAATSPPPPSRPAPGELPRSSRGPARCRLAGGDGPGVCVVTTGGGCRGRGGRVRGLPSPTTGGDAGGSVAAPTPSSPPPAWRPVPPEPPTPPAVTLSSRAPAQAAGASAPPSLPPPRFSPPASPSPAVDAHSGATTLFALRGASVAVDDTPLPPSPHSPPPPPPRRGARLDDSVGMRAPGHAAANAPRRRGRWLAGTGGWRPSARGRSHGRALRIFGGCCPAPTRPCSPLAPPPGPTYPPPRFPHFSSSQVCLPDTALPLLSRHIAIATLSLIDIHSWHARWMGRPTRRCMYTNVRYTQRAYEEAARDGFGGGKGSTPPPRYCTVHTGAVPSKLEQPRGGPPATAGAAAPALPQRRPPLRVPRSGNCALAVAARTPPRPPCRRLVQ